MDSLCCGYCKLPEDEESDPLIVDVMKVIEDKAWTVFRCSLGYFRRKLIRRSDYIIEVPENYFAFDQKGKPEFEPVDQLLSNCLGDIKKALSTTNLSSNSNKDKAKASPTKQEGSKSNGDALAVPSGDGDKRKKVDTDDENKDDDDRPDTTVSLDTTFCNDTTLPQIYHFKFSKVRTSKLDVSYHRGFTLGGKASFSLGLPKVLASGSLGLAAEKRLEVKKTQGQTFEETMSMEATSDINVAAKSTYVAKVQLEERLVHANFKVRVRMSMPQGRAPVYIKRKSDKVVVHVYNLSNLEDIFLGDSSAHFPSAQKVADEDEDGGGGDVVDFIVEGIVKGSLACDHTIDLSSDEKTPAAPV